MATTPTGIKITGLTDIGNAISPDTLLPVVNLTGTDITQKANIQITGNLILAGAGGANFVPARLANLAYSVVNSAQPNITSVGTLTNLTASGNITGNYIKGNGSQLTGIIASGGTANILANGTSNINIPVVNGNITMSSNGHANVVVVNGTDVFVSGTLLPTQVISNIIASNNYGNISLSAGASSWIFTNSGNLVLPGNTFTVNYANGSQVVLGDEFVANFTFTGDTMSTSDTGNTMYITAPTGNGEYLSNASSLIISAGNTNTGSGGDLILNGGNTGGCSQSAGNVLINGGYSGSSGSDGNIILTANNHSWTFSTDSNLYAPGNIVGPASANFLIYSNAGIHNFTFADDGTFYAPDNVVMSGTSISIGPGANELANLANAVFIASSNSEAFIQAVLNNVSDVGSADWIAQGHRGDDDGGWVDMGFTSSGFGDANYSLTGPGDGYIFTQSFYDGQSPGGRGGNLVLATGENGTVNDIVFATNGFLISNEFARISNANNALELTRAGANITFPGNLVIAGNTNAYGSSLSLIQTTNDLPLVSISSGANGAVSSLWVQDIGNIGSSNIAAVYANPIPGSGIVRIAVGQNGGSGPNLWDFNSNGTTTFPGDLIGNGASPAPSINGFASANFTGSLSVLGNINAGNISTSGSGGNISGANIISANTFTTTTGNIYIAPDDANLAAHLDIYLTAGPDIHIASNNENLIIGRDVGANLAITTSDQVTIKSYDSGNTTNHTWTFGTLGSLQFPVVAFANLPAATTPGLRAFISDANLSPIGNFGVEIGGGGGNYVPVFSDGANWCIG